MYCGKCGTLIPEKADFCSNCGTQVGYENNGNKQAFSCGKTENVKRKLSKKGIGIVSGASLAGILLIVLIIILTTGKGAFANTYQKTIDNYFKAIEKNDPELMYKKVIADYWINYIEEGYGDSYALEALEDTIEDYWDEYGDNIRITYKITNRDHASKDELASLNDNIYDWYAYYIYDDIKELKITDAYVISVDYKVKGSEGSGDYSADFLLVKEKGKWKMTRGSLGNSFYDNQ